ncbi:hypothetical protein NC651_004682 [Populus alba x Populus x berolinensis]|nr:hypothetical protein NC651_004682 [Populus alba x Populus x berolinensis]
MHASEYLKSNSRHSNIINHSQKFISFVSGGHFGCYPDHQCIFWRKSLLRAIYFGRNVVFGMLLRAAVTDELLVLDARRGYVYRFVQHTHYMPKKWRGKENTREGPARIIRGMMFYLRRWHQFSSHIIPCFCLFVTKAMWIDIFYSSYAVHFTVDVLKGVGPCLQGSKVARTGS